MKKYILYIFTLYSLALPAVASAATLTFSANPHDVGVGDMVEVTLTVDSDASLNALSGTLVYPKSALTPVAVSDGNSIVSLWVTAPVADAGKIPFAGLTPGGFAGHGGKVMSVLFKATSPGAAVVSLSDIELLQNDGTGTVEPARHAPLTLEVSSVSKGGFVEKDDTTQPELFQVYRTSGPDGQEYLAFSTTDKGSGVDHYEAAEYRWFSFSPAFTRTDTTYHIQDQYLTSTVLVRAIDRAGNARTVVFPRQNLLRPYEWLLLCGMLIVFLLWRRYR